MSTSEVRWKQRFKNFEAAHAQFKKAIQLSEQRTLSELEKQGLIQAFEFTHEVAWHVLKDYFEHQGNTQVTGSRDAVREGFQKGLLPDGQVWMEMIKSRNQTSHTYNQSTANEIVTKIQSEYATSFLTFEKTLRALSSKT